MGPKKGGKKGKKEEEEGPVEESQFDNMDLEMLREVAPMLRQQLDKSMLDRNYVQLERDAIQQYFDITKREVEEVELAIAAKDREMELLEDNHRVELRVYQQKVKHLEYEHKNNIKDIVTEGQGLLELQMQSHEGKEREQLKIKEQIKFQKMELELVNASKVAEIRQQHDKQLVKLRQQFDEGLNELIARSDTRLVNLERDLELRRKVEIHEVEERKNQHINDLIKNHNKAFHQMKCYYNDITSGNLQLIKSLQKQVEDLKDRCANNKRLLLEYAQENVKLSEPLSKVSAEIASFQALLKERAKDQMAFRNANARLTSIQKHSLEVKQRFKELEEQYNSVERERDQLYNSFEDTLHRVQQQSEFQNQTLEQRLRSLETNAEKTSLQVEEIIRAANLDPSEMARVTSSLRQMLSAKEDSINEVRFSVIRLQKAFNDQLDAVLAKFNDLGIPGDELLALGYKEEPLPKGSTRGPAGLISSA